jgi:hypothetical protein
MSYLIKSRASIHSFTFIGEHVMNRNTYIGTLTSVSLIEGNTAWVMIALALPVLVSIL